MAEHRSGLDEAVLFKNAVRADRGVGGQAGRRVHDRCRVHPRNGRGVGAETGGRAGVGQERTVGDEPRARTAGGVGL